MKNPATALIVALSVCLWASRDPGALTIVRVGGQDLPAPEGADLVQLTWEEAASGDFGSTRLIVFENGAISPVFASPDQNLTPSIRDKGGSVRVSTTAGRLQNEPQIDNLFDGNPASVYEGSAGKRSSEGQSGSYNAMALYDPGCDCVVDYKILVFNLGNPYNISRIRFGTRPGHAHDRFIPELTLGVAEGSPIRQGGVPGLLNRFKFGGPTRQLPLQVGHLEFDVLFEDFENTSAEFDLEIGRAVQAVVFAAPLELWEIAEFEIYGDGYVPEAGYVSGIIDFGGRASVDTLFWGGEEPPDASVRISARSGTDEDPQQYWRNTFRGDRRSRFDADGVELTRHAYRRLEGGEAAGITPDSENWNFWTAPAEFASGRLGLAATLPHRFAQFALDFSSASNAGGRMDYLQFEITQPPVASLIIAEIVPPETRLGEVTSFTYKLFAVVSGEDSGFDSIQFDVPVAPSVDEVRIGARTLASGEYEVEPWNGRYTVVHLPFIDIQLSGEPIEIDFRSEVFQASTLFSGRVFDSTRPREVRHRIAPGDVDPRTDGQGMTVRARNPRKRSIQKLSVSALTPDGDGVNEALEIQYELVNLAGNVPVSLEILDLAGRRVADLETAGRGSGRFWAAWDGRGRKTGGLLPPGLYLLRLTVKADSGTDTAVASFPLIY